MSSMKSGLSSVAKSMAAKVGVDVTPAGAPGEGLPVQVEFT
jgi:uncharacterized protein (UPF0303 family)